MATHTPLVSAKNLSISFGGVQALKGVNVEIAAGEIRCLAGENGSGKSTFVKMLAGVYQPDGGELIVGGQRIQNFNPMQASDAGIQVIFQDLSLFNHLSVGENIAINKVTHGKSWRVSRKKIHDIAAPQLDKVGITLDLDAPVSSLSMANKQLVAICRALAMDAKLLFMDEPTTALTGREVKRLLEIVQGLKDQGLSIVFISHKLDEVFSIADTITVFRDGFKVGDFAADELTEASLSKHMTGREVTYERYHRQQTTTEPLLEVKNLSRKGNYENISLDVRAGDIVGLTGLLGAGRTEFALTLFGLNKPDSGEILVAGEPVKITAPWEAMAQGIALVPEDRLEQGLFANQTVSSNVAVAVADRVTNPFGVLDAQKEKDFATQVVNDMGVNNKNTSAKISILSGGNQQKVVIGKWMLWEPQVLVLDSPTVGIDIGSKSEIYERIHRLAEQGIGVVFISDEVEEIVANCNRVYVLHEGRVIREFRERDMQSETLSHDLAEIISNPDLGKPIAGHVPPSEAGK
jgi:simple sugar transport system ATP-binding protein